MKSIYSKRKVGVGAHYTFNWITQTTAYCLVTCNQTKAGCRQDFGKTDGPVPFEVGPAVILIFTLPEKNA